MNFNDPIFWSFIVTMCSIALLTEGALLVHALFVTRQTLRWYLLLLLPLIVSIWSFTVAWYASSKFEYLSQVTHLHFTLAIYHALREMLAQLVLACQIQTAITMVVFAIMLFIRGSALPRSDRPPVWTLAIDRYLTANL